MTRSSDQFPTEVEGLPRARTSELFELGDRGQFELRIAPVAKQLGASTVRMLAYNGSIPGPTLRVRQGSKLVVNVVNQGDLEATVHWHGLRLENRYDGTTETQRPIPVGGSFTYRLEFSSNDGATWEVVRDGAANNGLYGWLPVTATTQGRIRVTSTANPAIQAISTRAFTVR